MSRQVCQGVLRRSKKPTLEEVGPKTVNGIRFEVPESGIR
jgi:hypothetical protein